MNGNFLLFIGAMVLAGSAPILAGWDRAWTEGLSSDAIAEFEIALGRGETKAKNCFQTFPKEAWADARGAVKLNVVFDGKKGRIVEATLQAPYASTEIAGCLRRAFIGEIVLPFDGEIRTAMVAFDPPS